MAFIRVSHSTEKFDPALVEVIRTQLYQQADAASLGSVDVAGIAETYFESKGKQVVLQAAKAAAAKSAAGAKFPASEAAKPAAKDKKKLKLKKPAASADE